MRFHHFLTASLQPASLAFRGSSPSAAAPEFEDHLIQLLERHDLALVPRSELTDVLKELNGLLKREKLETPLYKRQNGNA